MSKKFAKDALGTRMKRYEMATDHLLTRRACVIVRVDGQAFHTYTKGFERPFDGKIMGSMQHAAVRLAEAMCGFKAGYIQSDEASFLLTDYDDVNTQAWFDNSLNKLVSISASTMTAHFNHWMSTNFKIAKIATFDARVFVLPEADVANYFLWRAKDWERNSLSMYARKHFSAKELMGKKRSDQHELLHGKGKNWTRDLNSQIRNGTWLHRTEDGIKVTYSIVPKYPEVAAFIQKVLPVKEGATAA